MKKTVQKLLNHENFMDDVMDYQKFKLNKKVKEECMIDLNEATQPYFIQDQKCTINIPVSQLDRIQIFLKDRDLLQMKEENAEKPRTCKAKTIRAI